MELQSSSVVSKAKTRVTGKEDNSYGYVQKARKEERSEKSITSQPGNTADLSRKDQDNRGKSQGEVTAKVARKDKDGKREKHVVDGKKVTLYDEIKKTVKKDQPSRLHARREMLKVLYPIVETPTEAAGKKKATKKVDLTEKLFSELGVKYAGRNGGYTRIVTIGQRKGDGAMEVILELV